MPVDNNIPFDGVCEDEDPGLALGFNGDNTVGRDGGATCSLTFRRMGGRPPGPVPRLEPPPLALTDDRESTVKPDGPSPPEVCRRAFSCRICTVRKCDSSSCHLISSRPSLDRVAAVETPLREEKPSTNNHGLNAVRD